eukprot:209522_1
MCMDRFCQGLSMGSAWTFFAICNLDLMIIGLVLELRVNLYFDMVSMVSLHGKCMCFYAIFTSYLFPPTHRYLFPHPTFDHRIDLFHRLWQPIPIGSAWHLLCWFSRYMCGVKYAFICHIKMKTTIYCWVSTSNTRKNTAGASEC